MILMSMLFALPLMGRAEGVDFYKGTVYEALDVARSEGKLLLVEFYAPWSHKSRWMHDNVLLKSGVNQWFIVVSVDTNSEAGAALAVEYQVADYPVLLVCNAGGVVLDKIDRTLELADFEARLQTVRISTDRQSVRQLQQIFTLSDSDDPATKKKVNELVDRYISSQDTDVLTSASHWDLFATSSITYYGSPSYKFLAQNVDRFFSVDVAKSRIEMVVSDALIPYVIGSLPFDEQTVSAIESDSLSLSHYPMCRHLCVLSRLRAENNATQYVSTLASLIDKVSEDYEYQLVMSLDFAAQTLDQTDRSTRVTARRMLENLMQKSPSPAKTALIESLLAKFS